MPKPKRRINKLQKSEHSSKSRALLPGSPSFASKAVLAFVLLTGTFVLYSPVRNHAFITYDDYQYVRDNTNVNTGLKWATVGWAMTSTEQANWHPITWLSHALDCQLFGLNAGPHHLTNVALHALNVLLVFWLLQLATGATVRSFMVAALFAWHPINVQSVAWVAERKNVLSLFFFLLAIAAYGWYARKPQVKRFTMVAICFVLALASKPQAVTLPFVLLLLDFWPLRRVSEWTPVSTEFSLPQKSLRHLILEKLTLLALAAASCVITVWAQRAEGALESLEEFSLRVRLENSLYSYLLYLWKTFWLAGYAAFYPHPGPTLAYWKPALALIVLIATSVAVSRQRRTHPYLLVGWLWFLGTLVPMIGIVQVGDQAMADRYAYLPLIGVFLIAVWGIADVLDCYRVGVPRFAVACVVLIGTALVSFEQLGYWKDTEAVWSHALEVSRGDPRVETKFGNALVVLGEPEAALPHLVAAVKFNPEDTVVRVNLGMCFLAHGRIAEGIQQFQAAIRLTDSSNPDAKTRQFRASALIDLGIAHVFAKEYEEALASFRRARQADATMVDDAMLRIEHSLPSSPSEEDYLSLSLMARAKGTDAEASAAFENASGTNAEHVADQPSLHGSDKSPQ